MSQVPTVRGQIRIQSSRYDPLIEVVDESIIELIKWGLAILRITCDDAVDSEDDAFNVVIVIIVVIRDILNATLAVEVEDEKVVGLRVEEKIPGREISMHNTKLQVQIIHNGGQLLEVS